MRSDIESPSVPRVACAPRPAGSASGGDSPAVGCVASSRWDDHRGRWRCDARCMRKASFPLVLLALVFAVSGCGGGSSTTTSTTSAAPAAQWADGLCSALLTYKDAIQTAGATLKSGAVSGSAIDEATSSVTGATEDFRDDVEALPDPQLASAQTIQDTLTNLSGE